MHSKERGGIAISHQLDVVEERIVFAKIYGKTDMQGGIKMKKGKSQRFFLFMLGN